MVLKYIIPLLVWMLAFPVQAQDSEGHAGLGGGLAVVPRYPGSDRHETRFFPLISFSFGRLFVGGDPGGGEGGGVGMRLFGDKNWTLGFALSADFGKAREESDDPRLQGLGDIDGTVRATLFTVYQYRWLALRAGVSPDIGGENQGTLARFDIFGRYPATERLIFNAGPGLTWASGQYARTFFAIDAEQSARSGLPQYEAARGVNNVRVSIGATYLMTKSWTAGARAARAKLVGDAADSPLTADRWQDAFAVFLNYRF